MAITFKDAFDILKNEKNVKYKDLKKICDNFFGGTYGMRSSGSSHTIYKTPWPGDPRVNIQKLGNMAKPYQVKQVCKALKMLQDIKGVKIEE
jgi:hypothetical protein